MDDGPQRGQNVRRRELIALLAAGPWPAAALAQVAGRIYRVGSIYGARYDEPQHRGFRSGLARLGFVDGRNAVFETSGYELRREQYDAHAKLLVDTKVDVILAAGDVGIRAAQHATKTIPIVGITDDMVGSGLVRSLADPGGNTTGVSLLASELDGKRQQILIELLAGSHRIAALVDGQQTPASKIEALRSAARARGVEVSFHLAATPEQIGPAIAGAKAAGAAGINVLATPLFFNNQKILFEHIELHGLPAIYQWPDMAREGGLIAYGPNIVQVFRDQVAQIVAKVLRGESPAKIPVENPTRFELVINAKAARSLGLQIPSTLLAQADDVVQ